MNPYGSALKAFSQEQNTLTLILHNSYGEAEDMPELEKMALTVSEGAVLDVGAGTGSHTLCLQRMGCDVTAIDINPQAVEIMKASGVKDPRTADFFGFEGKNQFDTLFCLMNGIGFIGKLDRLTLFLEKAAELLKPGGQIILDSSEVDYLYDDASKPKDRYYGEVSFQYEYEGRKGDWFDWVYIDSNTLDRLAYEAGWFVYFLHTDENGQYLARLIRR